MWCEYQFYIIKASIYTLLHKSCLPKIQQICGYREELRNRRKRKLCGRRWHVFSRIRELFAQLVIGNNEFNWWNLEPQESYPYEIHNIQAKRIPRLEASYLGSLWDLHCAKFDEFVLNLTTFTQFSIFLLKLCGGP